MPFLTLSMYNNKCVLAYVAFVILYNNMMHEIKKGEGNLSRLQKAREIAYIRGLPLLVLPASQPSKIGRCTAAQAYSPCF